MRAAQRLVLAIASLLFLALPGMAAEEIVSYVSNLSLAVDGTVTVTEILDVSVENNEINHGIYRDIPVTMVDENQELVRPSINVMSVTRDDAPEPFRTENIYDDGGVVAFVRIWIGDAEVWVNPGQVRYTITYSLSRMGRFFPDHDEVYWNATGNYWIFPILSAVATVTLPDGAVISDISGYTGPVGSTAQDVTISRKGDNKASIRANARLGVGEGMTYAVSFQKGILVEPSSLTKAMYWLIDHQDPVLPGGGALLALLFMLWAWNKVGRDPKKGTIIPLFHPPTTLSPGLAHYVAHWGWAKNGWTAFTASIFDLGVKGLVSIDNTGDLRVTPTGKQPEQPLPAGAAAIFDYVQSTGGFTVNKITGPTIDKQRTAFLNSTKAESGEPWFSNNLGYTALGIAFGAVLLVLMIWFGISFLSAAVAMVAVVVMVLVFGNLMRAPTVPGRAMMDQIDGFKMYMNTAEKNRLNMDKEPPMTVERFERILPFAIALGVERPWSDHFEGELARNAVVGATVGSYHPMWYSGSNFSSNTIAAAVSTAASSMSAAMVAAQPVQSSSSGSRGGGSSGGGGGGGGGGGW